MTMIMDPRVRDGAINSERPGFDPSCFHGVLREERDDNNNVGSEFRARGNDRLCLHESSLFL